MRCGLIDGGQGAADGGGVGGIGLDDDLGLLAADQLAGEVAGNGDDELHRAALEQFVGFLLGGHGVGEAEIAGIADGADQGAGDGAVVSRENRGGQALGVVVDGKAEEDELHDRHAEHHGEGQPVAAQLQGFLDDHGHEAAEKSHGASPQAASALSRAWPIRWMKTSSRVGSDFSHVIFLSRRRGAMAAASSAASGPQT